MDGNNRWARARGLSSAQGHRAGVESLRAVIRRAAERRVETLTLFAFSSENWRRPSAEVGALMELFMLVLKREVKKLHENDIRLTIIGERRRFSTSLQKQMGRAEALTRDNPGMHLVVAANYGGRWDIAQAARRLSQRVADGQIAPDEIDEKMLDREICLAHEAPVDLCIRTSGEQRISNFLLWQMAYAEFVFAQELWPDFDGDAFDAALLAYQQRQRRFGMSQQQVEVQGA
ncbi:ditrans,polycis-undecaprenyl-diphosphate synthase ((2E,6E)-farnesyl-diphosphate specific) [Salinicola rhizosphaerae]|uniref:Ditrans,polycis-undecaprenyl-diphosphate synthase ((2E,6E)-farnesyl-diphosphate specific) n=2 Tax=Salinicola rhizosphaerae TaxID=1443141 RepID=A0ABQ3E3N1_9GAMM|nr:ditrans,polycis-undecaprenyl-diphosphate synthase ((2E,6E)-farnesyl-diphosphate specific) [Salinicola rhizosphaerae]